MKNWKIKTKLLFALCGILLFTTVLEIISIRQTIVINNKYKQSINSNVLPMKNLMDVIIAFTNVRKTARGFAGRVIADRTQLKVQKEKLQKRIDAMSEQTDVLIQILTEAESDERMLQLAIKIQKEYKDIFKPKIMNMIELVESGQGNLTEVIKTFDLAKEITEQIYADILELYELNISNINYTVEQNTELVNNEILLSVIIIIITLIIITFFSFMLSKSISQPMKQASEIASNIVKGDTNVNFTVDSKDEIGTLMNSVKEMLGSVVYYDTQNQERKRYILNEIDKLLENILKISKGDIAFNLTAEPPNEWTQWDYENFSIIAENLSLIQDKIHWYDSILNSFSDVLISVTDLNKKIIYINRASQITIGTTNEKAKGRYCCDVLHMSNCSNHKVGSAKCAIEHLKEGKGKVLVNIGEFVFSSTAYRMIDRHNNHIGYIKVMKDITEATDIEEYGKRAVKRLATNIQRLSRGNTNFNFDVELPNEHTQKEYDNFGEIAANLEMVRVAIKHLQEDTIFLADATDLGNVELRANVTKHSGDFKQIVIAMNHIVDNYQILTTQITNIIRSIDEDAFMIYGTLVGLEDTLFNDNLLQNTDIKNSIEKIYSITKKHQVGAASDKTVKQILGKMQEVSEIIKTLANIVKYL